MPKVTFDDLPDHGRLWVFPASRDLTDAEAEELLAAVDEFLAGWMAHGAPLRSAHRFEGRRFLLVGVDVDVEAPSGCSIDALVNRLRGVGEAMGVTLIDHAPIWFRDGGSVRTVPRAEFRSLVAAGNVGPESPVFDTTLTSVAQARAGALERPAAATWHRKAFFGAHASR